MTIEGKDLTELFTNTVEVVAKEKIEISIEITPDSFNVCIQPWKPYEMRCPYGKE